MSMFSNYFGLLALQNVLDQLSNRVSSLDDRLVNSFGNSVTTSINSWLLNHPFCSWLVNHPLISLLTGLVAVVLLVRLVATIYRAIANTIDRMWLWILQSPFLLLKFLFGWEVKSQKITPSTTVTNYEVTNNPEQLAAIILRLDTIQQQQQQILEDLAQLKKSSAVVELEQISLTSSSNR